MPDLPTGTVTLLFTDIDGSTQLLQRLGPRYGNVLADYRALLRSVFAKHGGQEVDTQGDSFFIAFSRALDAVQAAIEVQRALVEHPWPEGVSLATRMGLHTGEPQRGGEGYVGLDVHRAARIGMVGHGGQVLLSDGTRGIIAHDLPEDVTLRDLGEHRLKDLRHPRRLWQLVIADLSSDFRPLKTLDVRPNNLPLQLTSFVGREQEVATILQRLRDPQIRLLTLTGPGGTGKTRLSLQVAADLLDDFPDGVWFVDLAPIRDPTLVASAIAEPLGVTKSSDQSLSERLTTFLRNKHLLLVLDNFEQVVNAAPLVADLLKAAPQIKALVTSRIVLHVSGEQEYPVPPLALPNLRHLPQLDALQEYSVISLFCQRAQAVKPDFQVTTENAASVADICVRLDGLPLAIELAAARIKLFPPQALLRRLDQRFKTLKGGARDLPARQQTLRGAIDWSYALLDPDEQTLFRRLGVFVGGWTVEAMERVCAGPDDVQGDVLDGLTSLVDKSLVRQQEGLQDEPRFAMLETIREYAMEQLVASGEAETVRRRHFLYYLDLAQQAEPQLVGPEQGVSLARLEVEHDNLRAALVWSHSLQDDGVLGLQLAASLGHFWWCRGHLSEGRQWLAAALERGTKAPAAARAKALRGAAILALLQSDYTLARDWLTESAALERSTGPPSLLAQTLGVLAFVSLFQGDVDAARAAWAEAETLMQTLDDIESRANAWWRRALLATLEGNDGQAAEAAEAALSLTRAMGDMDSIGSSLGLLGEIYLRQGRYAEARAVLTESLALFRSLGDTSGIPWALMNLGLVANAEGDNTRAPTLLTEGLRLFWELRQKRDCVLCMEGLASVYATNSRVDRAVRLLGAVVRLREAIGAPRLPMDYAAYAQSIAGVVAQLDDPRWATAWAEGRAMTLEQAIAYALEETPEE